MVRDYGEHGVSTFHHNCWQMAHVFDQLILPHIIDRPTHVYFEHLNWDEAKPEELAHAFSLLVKLLKSHRNGIFCCCLGDTDFSTIAQELSSTNKTYYKKDQLAKDKELVQMHTDFALVLQVPFHAALDAF